MQKKPIVIYLMGPTATGKTNLAVELVHKLPCDIISVDSAKVYREMDIGTAKPNKAILSIAPHRLIDILDPSETYSAAQFCHDAKQEIDHIVSRERIPLLVGGTMLYFRALQQGLSPLPSSSPAIREKLLYEAKTEGLEKLHQRLKEVDPISAERIHSNDPQRLQRALEVYEITGQPMSMFLNNTQNSLPYEIVSIAIVSEDRMNLHKRIAERFNHMLQEGFVEEVIKLYQRGDLTPDMPAIRSVGYRQIWEYLAGKFSYNEMCEKGIIASRQLAKRQLTWLRSWHELKTFDHENKNLLQEVFTLLKNRIFE